MPIGPGSRLDSYELIDRLGRGGMGEVYKAWDSKLQRFVALKVLSELWRGDSSSLVRFEREARVLASLNHPNIVGIFDFGQSEGHAYAVMELLEGRDLRAVLDEEGPLPFRRALEVASHAALGLSAAHRAGVIHRDLKPANIFLESNGRVKLLDFGIAKRLSAPAPGGDFPEEGSHPTSTNAGILLGTVGYMAPEQLQSGGAVDARSDLFALGCVLYEMITGEHAFASETPMGTLHAILTQDPNLDRPELTSGLRELLQHCLAKPQDQRFQDAQDLSYALESLQRPLSGAFPTLPEEPSRRFRWWIPATLLGAGALLAFGAYRLRPSRALPVFTPLSAFEGQVYGARFLEDARTVYAIRQGDQEPQVIEVSRNGEESAVAGIQGSVPVCAPTGGGWLALRGIRRLDRGREQIEGDLGAVEGSGTWRTLSDGVSGADASPDGSMVAVVRHLDGRYRIEAPLGAVRIESEGWLESPRLSRSGAHLAFIERAVNGDGASLQILDMGDGSRRTLLQAWRDLRGLAWAAPGEIWFTGSKSGGPRALFSVSLNGKVRTLLTNPENLTLQDVDPEGRALICQEHVSFAVMARAPSRDPGPIEGMDPRLLGLSSDGQWAAVASPGDAAEGKIYLIQADRGSQLLGQARLAAPSPDGSETALASPGTSGWRLWIWSRQGTRDAGLKDFTSLRQIAWAPDGNAIFFSAAAGSHGFRIWRLQLDGTDPKPVCPEGILPDRPFLMSPDGRWLLAEIGPLLARFDLRDPEVPPQSVLGMSPGEHLMGWGRDATHVFVAGPRLPGLVASLDLADGSRQAAFPLPAGGHAGALIDNALTAQGGEAYAIGCRETRSRLFLVTGLR